ncbi:MAG: hypothetical protein ABIQ40_18675 [Bacteroidia bacterium]
MNTEKEKSQSQGKTIFIKYSNWKKGQHFETVLQSMPDEKKKVLIGRIYLEIEGNQKTYTAKSADGREVLHVSDSYVDTEKHMIKNGHALGMEELQKKQSRDQEREETPTPQTKTQEVPKNEVSKAPEKEVEEIRERKAEQSKGNDLNR